jgi:hypothetical protein
MLSSWRRRTTKTTEHRRTARRAAVPNPGPPDVRIIDENIIRETVTSQNDEPVDKIIFHRVSEP